MYKYDDAIHIVGKEFVDSWLLGSGSFHGQDVVYLQGSSGTHTDPYRYPVMANELEDLWKCEACGRVYKLSEHLHCESCGTSVTEKSRFVLE